MKFKITIKKTKKIIIIEAKSILEANEKASMIALDYFLKRID